MCVVTQVIKQPTQSVDDNHYIFSFFPSFTLSLSLPPSLSLSLSLSLSHTHTHTQVILQDAHNIQTHEVSINMLEEAQDIIKYQEMMADAGGRGIKGSSQVVPMDCSALMTPPRQERRCLAPINSTTTMV